MKGAKRRRQQIKMNENSRKKNLQYIKSSERKGENKKLQKCRDAELQNYQNVKKQEKNRKK